MESLSLSTDLPPFRVVVCPSSVYGSYPLSDQVEDRPLNDETPHTEAGLREAADQFSRRDIMPEIGPEPTSERIGRHRAAVP